MQGRVFFILSIALIFLVFSTISFAKTYGQLLCKYPGFKCHKVKRGQSWTTLFKDERERGVVMRVNRMNTEIYPGMVIAVPEDLSGDILDFSPFPRQIATTNEKVIVVDPAEQAWGAYDSSGTLIRWGPASSGMNFCKDIQRSCETHEGSFRIFSLGSSDCYSTKFPLPDGGAPMPYCMYFNNGQALHGEPNGLPGFNASHGCVRLYVNDAEWLRYDFAEAPNSNNKFKGTRIVVRGYD